MKNKEFMRKVRNFWYNKLSVYNQIFKCLTNEDSGFVF